MQIKPKSAGFNGMRQVLLIPYGAGTAKLDHGETIKTGANFVQTPNIIV
jgi:hypothetical protein